MTTLAQIIARKSATERADIKRTTAAAKALGWVELSTFDFGARLLAYAPSIANATVKARFIEAGTLLQAHDELCYDDFLAWVEEVKGWHDAGYIRHLLTCFAGDPATRKYIRKFYRAKYPEVEDAAWL